MYCKFLKRIKLKKLKAKILLLNGIKFLISGCELTISLNQVLIANQFLLDKISNLAHKKLKSKFIDTFFQK